MSFSASITTSIVPIIPSHIRVYPNCSIHFRRFFPSIEWVAVEGQKEGVPVKPDRSIVFDILSQSPTPKAEVLYVGDSGVDMETARRACVDSVGVTWGFRPMTELKAYHADHIINTPEAILDIVSAQ